MEADIAKVLSYEIRKEVADRYFGFRKLIEEDSQDLQRKMKHQSRTAEQAVGHALTRIYILLGDEGLIHDFLQVVGLEERMFYDPYLLESPTLRARALEGLRARGFTRARRFKNLLLDSYELLEESVAVYRERFDELEDNLATIKEEISIFYRKNDLGNIMQFFRSMDGGHDSSLFGGIQSGVSDKLESTLRIDPPSPIEQSLPLIPPLMPLKSVAKQLKQLAERAYQLYES